MNINKALSVKSDFSLGNAMMQVKTIAERASSLGYDTVALVDVMTISNMVPFFNAMKKVNIRPIIGATIRVFDDPTYRKPPKASGEVERANPQVWVKVYAKTDKGLRSIMKLLTKANSESNFYYTARAGLDDVLKLDDVVVTTGDNFNLFSHPTNAEGMAAQLFERFGDDFYVEVTPVNTPLWKKTNRRAVEFSEAKGCRIVASYPALYPDESAADTMDVMRAISDNSKVTDPWLPIPYTRDFTFKTPRDLATALVKAKLPSVKALQGLEQITSVCTYEFKKLEPSLPVMAPNEFAALVEQCKEGWVTRFSGKVLGHQPDPAELMGVYKERLAYELGVLKKMGFSGYFLLVADIVRWSKGAGIMVGPGRGSVGGSLVAYLTGITDVDPIRFGLLFERFINPERLDLPDADLDFMSGRRHEVIDYISGKYGADRVANISNYNTMGAAGVLRDVSRVHGLEPIDYACSKQVEKEHGVAKTLEESLESVPDIEKFALRFPNVWKHAIGLEGNMRTLGKHAAGVVVAGEPLIERAVLDTRSGDIPVANWDKRTVEDWGLIKMDILGLSTLDTLALGAQYVRERHKKQINWLSLPLDDARTLAAFGKGDTTGIFQFESGGMRTLLKELALSGNLTFEDTAAVTALYRPGPLDAGLCDEYVAVRQGVKTAYLEHPNMAPALQETGGIIVYQEQVMRIAQDVAGFTMAGADHLRKAMGKKDAEMMAAQREKWVAGCVSHSGMTEERANLLFDKIELFAGYAFNKSHSVEYSIISFWAMWLKVNYPAEFYAASMSTVEDENKLGALVTDAKRFDIEVMPPDINKSTGRIEIVGERTLYAPLQAIKGISEKVASYIMTARDGTAVEVADESGDPVIKWIVADDAVGTGRFENMADFNARLKASGIGGKVNVRHKEALEKVGAFVSVTPPDPVSGKPPLPPLHPDRLRDRLSLMPGFTVDMVKATRNIANDTITMTGLTRLAQDCQACQGCSLKDAGHPLPRIGKRPKFMIVQDSPSWVEDKAGKMMEGEGADFLIAAMKDAGLSPQDVYFTSLVKATKPKGQKFLTNEQLNGCTEWLQKEIALLKPPVILALGSATTKFFAPSLKAQEVVGKVIYDAKIDASVVFGINPLQVLFDGSKINLLRTSVEKVAELIN